jgi:two-component system, sensor histidine kinase YesM
MGDDIRNMAKSFNLMAIRLEELVEKVKEDQHQIEQIKLNALQSQIQPHFLYNTLDCIHWQALVDGNERISVLVKALANYYRLCLSKGQDIISLSQELAHVQNYLIIQNIRYGNIIEQSFEIEERFLKVPIPKMTLQPLVENAIYHGIKVKNGKHGKITITAREENDKVVISVSDSGAGVSQKKIDEINSSISIYDESFGYGVRNVHKRIELLYGKGNGLYFRKNNTGGITVEIRLPYSSDL